MLLLPTWNSCPGLFSQSRECLWGRQDGGSIQGLPHRPYTEHSWDRPRNHFYHRHDHLRDCDKDRPLTERLQLPRTHQPQPFACIHCKLLFPDSKKRGPMKPTIWV